MGHTVNFRTKKLSYKDKNSVHNSPEDWIIFENTQEAIVDEETRITVQKIRETKLNNPASMSRLSGNRKPQIRF